MSPTPHDSQDTDSDPSDRSPSHPGDDRTSGATKGIWGRWVATSSSHPEVEPTKHLLSVRGAVLLVLAAIVGGSAGTVIANRAYGILPGPEMSAKYYKESEERWATLDFSPDVVAEMKWANSVVVSRNAGLALGIIGTILGGLFGAIVGIDWKSPAAVVRGLLGGIVLGCLFGFTAGYAGGKIQLILEGFQVDVTRPGDLSGAWLRRMYSAIALHAIEWSLAAIGIALAIRLADSSRNLPMKRIVSLLLLGAVFSSVVYTPLAAWLFPGLTSEVPFPEGTWNRLMFTLLPSIGMALMLGKALHTPASSRVAALTTS